MKTLEHPLRAVSTDTAHSLHSTSDSTPRRAPPARARRGNYTAQETARPRRAAHLRPGHRSGGAFTAQDGAFTVPTVRLPRNTVALPEKSHRYHRGAVLGAMGMQPASARARSGGFASLTAESGGRRTPFCQKSVDTARPRQRSQAAALAPCRWRRAGLRASSAADCGSHRRREGAEMSGGCTAGA